MTNEDRLKERIALLKLRGEMNGQPEDNPYDAMGRGASPQTALRLEALGNRFAYPGKFDSLQQQGIYPVRPEFVGDNYYGSGTYQYTGPNEGAIELNINKPWNDNTEEIISHELRHKQTGNMGGIESWRHPSSEGAQNLDRFINSVESEKWRIPNERYAYGGDKVLGENIKYYLPGDLQRTLAGRKIGVKSK